MRNLIQTQHTGTKSNNTIHDCDRVVTMRSIDLETLLNYYLTCVCLDFNLNNNKDNEDKGRSTE